GHHEKVKELVKLLELNQMSYLKIQKKSFLVKLGHSPGKLEYSGNNASGTKKYQGSNSGDGAKTKDGVKIIGGVIEFGGGIGYVVARRTLMAEKRKVVIVKFVNANTASTSNSGTLPSNTIVNPRSDLKAITTRSGVSYDGPQIPPPHSFLPPVVENKPEATKDTVNPTNNGNTEDVQPQAVHPKPVTSQISEPTITPVSASRPNPQASISRCSGTEDFDDWKKKSTYC
nr:reverse transcriptase domain-containing protein [Tanacetum cinerariifolium]